MSTLELVPFMGHQLEAVEHDGKIWAVVKRICQNLGIDDRSQREKLSSLPWATGVIITSVAADGKGREQFCVDLDTLPMWLATIHPGKVAAHAREALERYQQHCKQVLADHFLGRHQMAAQNHAAQQYAAGLQAGQALVLQMMAACVGGAQQALQLHGPRVLHNPAAPFQGAALPARETTTPRPRWTPPPPPAPPTPIQPGKPKGKLEKLIAASLQDGSQTSKGLARLLRRSYPEVARVLTEMEARNVVERLGGPRSPVGAWRLVS